MMCLHVLMGLEGDQDQKSQSLMCKSRNGFKYATCFQRLYPTHTSRHEQHLTSFRHFQKIEPCRRYNQVDQKCNRIPWFLWPCCFYGNILDSILRSGRIRAGSLTRDTFRYLQSVLIQCLNSSDHSLGTSHKYQAENGFFFCVQSLQKSTKIKGCAITAW